MIRKSTKQSYQMQRKINEKTNNAVTSFVCIRWNASKRNQCWREQVQWHSVFLRWPPFYPLFLSGFTSHLSQHSCASFFQIIRIFSGISILNAKVIQKLIKIIRLLRRHFRKLRMAYTIMNSFRQGLFQPNFSFDSLERSSVFTGHFSSDF